MRYIAITKSGKMRQENVGKLGIGGKARKVIKIQIAQVINPIPNYLNKHSPCHAGARRNMKKRKWIYIMKPDQYKISCDICTGSNIEWSEYDGMIWCYDCEKDTKGSEGIFGGPIPVMHSLPELVNALSLFGLSLDRIDLKTGKRLYMHVAGNKITWGDWKEGK